MPNQDFAPVGLPATIADEVELDALLTSPSAELVAFATTLSGPIIVLGAGGKMGPTLAVRLQRAIDLSGAGAHVIAVSRFSDPTSRQWLADRRVKTLSADLLRHDSLHQLPDSDSIIYLVGSKFGTRQNPSHTWAVNTLAPACAMTRYRDAKFVALSTGNVYAFTNVISGGSIESDRLQPVGEYAWAALGRERIFAHFSSHNSTPVTIVRLNYATDLRYGVLTDLACQIHAGQAIDLTQGHFNCIWQGDANEIIIRALGLAASPPDPINLTSVETLSVRDVATEIAERMNRQAIFTGQESSTALLSNAAKCAGLFGKPATPIRDVIRWTADWVSRGGRLLGKPTHFEVRDGGF